MSGLQHIHEYPSKICHSESFQEAVFLMPICVYVIYPCVVIRISQPVEIIKISLDGEKTVYHFHCSYLLLLNTIPSFLVLPAKDLFIDGN